MANDDDVVGVGVDVNIVTWSHSMMIRFDLIATSLVSMRSASSTSS